MLGVLHANGVAVARPLAYCQPRGPGVKHEEALIMSDLGDCSNGMKYVKQLILENDVTSLREFEDRVIDIISALVEVGILDLDCSLENFVVTPTGNVFKVDLECGVHLPLRFNACYGVMLGTMVGTLAFAVQPRIELAEEFSAQLFSRLQPPTRVLQAAQVKVNEMMDRQRRRCGIDTRVSLAYI